MTTPECASCCCGTVVWLTADDKRHGSKTLERLDEKAKCCETPNYLFLTPQVLEGLEAGHKARLLEKNPWIKGADSLSKNPWQSRR